MDRSAGAKTTPPSSPRPLSIKVLAIAYGLSAMVGVYFLFIFIGDDATRPLASLYALLEALLMLGLAFGLWQLSQLARRVAIGWQCYVLIAFLVSLVPC